MTHYAIPGLKDKRVKPNTEKLEFILNEVAKRVGVEVEDVLGFRRFRELPLARHIFCKLARLNTSATLFEIAQFLGKRDHTTIIYSVQTCNDLMFSDKSVKEMYYSIEEVLNQDEGFRQ